MSELLDEGFKAGTGVISFFYTASSSNFLSCAPKLKKGSQKELMGKCLHRELNDGVL